MSQTVAFKTKVKRLEKRAAMLREAVEDLSSRRDYLSCRESVLNAWCQGLSVLDQLSAVAPSARKGLGPCYTQLAMLQQQEQLLKQQLPNSPYETDPSSSQPTALDTDEAGVQTIAPLADPLQHFRQLTAQPCRPEAVLMNVVGLSQLYRSVVMDMSMQLHLLDNGYASGQEEVMQRIKAGWERYLQAQVSLVLSDKHAVVEAHYTYNCDRMVPFATLPEHAPDLASAAAAKVPQLQLSSNQLRNIAVGIAVLQEQLDAIASERQSLQSAIAEEALCGCGSTGHSMGCNSGVGSPALTTSGSSLSGFSDESGSCHSTTTCVYHTRCHTSYCNALCRRWNQLDYQQHRLRKLGVLMRKEALMRVSGMSWFLGCLSWKQLAQAAVLCWPYPLQLSIWPVAIQLYYQQQQQMLYKEQMMQQEMLKARAQARKQAIAHKAQLAGVSKSRCSD